MKITKYQKIMARIGLITTAQMYCLKAGKIDMAIIWMGHRRELMVKAMTMTAQEASEYAVS
jgi:hypothetical protein